MRIDLPVISNRHYQMPFWRAMDRGATRCVKSWHRRAGKDITDFQFMVRAAMRRKGTYYYYFPTLELGKRALWDNIVEFYKDGEIVAGGNMLDILCPLAIQRRRNNSDYFIELINGSIIKLGGTDNLSVIGMNGYGYVFSEWQSQKKEAFGFISPILRENGGWALFNGTMRGKRNHLYQDIKKTEGLYGWFSQWLTPEDTKDYYWINEEDGICVNPELEGRIHPDTHRPYDNIQRNVDGGEISMALAMQEYLNRADSEIYGGYYAYELKKAISSGRICNLNGSGPVYTVWDLGGDKQDSDMTCIIFFTYDKHTNRCEVIDYYKNTGKRRGHYIEILSQKPYSYGGHFVPHDAKRSNAWSGEGFYETALRQFGVEVRYIPKTNSITNDIEITRRGFVNTWFDSNKNVEQLIDSLKLYHEKESTGKPCHQNNCSECNGASHDADAFRYMQMAIHLNIVEPYIKTKSKQEVDIYSSDMLFLT